MQPAVDSVSDEVAGLLAEKQRYQAVLDHAADIVIVTDESGRVVYITPNVQAVLGYPPDRFTDGMWDIIHPDDHGMAREMSAQCRARPGEFVRGVGRHRHADGTWRWLDVTAVNLLDDPAVHGVVTTFRDVTDRRLTEAALRQSEERFRALVANLFDAVAVVSPEGRFTFVAESVRDVLGHEPADLLGTLALDLAHPDDRELGESIAAELAEAPQLTVSRTLRGRHADGSWRWIETRAANHLDTAAVNGIVLTFRDVTAFREERERLERSEARFRALVQHSLDVVQIFDTDGRTTWVSPAVTAVLGYEPDELIGTTGEDMSHPEDYPAVVAKVGEMLARGDASVRTESRTRRKDGSYVWVDSITTNHLDDPAVRGIVTHYRDITLRREAEQAVRTSEARWRSVAGASPIGIYELDAEPVLRFVNERWQEIIGVDADHAIGSNWQPFLHVDDRPLMAEQWARTGAVGQPFRGMLRVVRPDGEVRWVMSATEPLFDEAGEITGHVGTLEDITERLAAQRDTERLSDIVEATSDLVVITDRQNRLLYMNTAARRFFDLEPNASIADFDFTPFTPRWAQDVYMNETRPALKDASIWSGDFAYYKDGVEVPVSALFLAHRDGDGRIEFVSSVTRDMSERKAFEARLEYQATHDPLTGLPNRTLFLDRLELALARSRRTRRPVAVLFCDLDHFKVVNDSLGHGAGDRLLVALAQRLRDALRPGDTVARFGGDEFVILCDELVAQQDAVVVADRVHRAVHEPMSIGSTEVFAAVSIGIAFATGDDTEPETMIRDADAAMYLAKAKGRARYEIYDETMRATLVERLDIESALRRALTRHELRVVYQPTIDLETGSIGGVEALLRWEHPERGLLVPSEFIDVAEETGLIVPIGTWVIEQACRQAQRWRAQGDGHRLLVSVNLSGRQLDDPSLIDTIADILATTSLEPGQLGLEITESVVMRDPEASVKALEALQTLGVHLAVDDFGTGYSSLAYLQRFPVELLKVDRAFVDGLGAGRDSQDRAIVAAVVSLAHTLGMRAIAEGVETPEQLADLRELGCDMAQGFFIAKPLSAPALDDLLARAPRW